MYNEALNSCIICDKILVTMYEVELKAHVKNRIDVIEKINSFAQFDSIVVKNDKYYHLNIHDENGDHCSERVRKSSLKHMTARIRSEKLLLPGEYDEKTLTPTKDASGEEKIYLTYKRKERREDSKGVTVEVNDEKECIISDSEPMEIILEDSGYVLATIKHKDAVGWFFETPYGKAHLELCTIPPLGDFLEIEILSETKETSLTEKIRLELVKIIEKAGLTNKDIEKKYYSEMLREAKARRKNV